MIEQKMLRSYVHMIDDRLKKSFHVIEFSNSKSSNSKSTIKDFKINFLKLEQFVGLTEKNKKTTS